MTDGHKKQIQKMKKADLINELIYRIENENPKPEVVEKIVTKVVADPDIVREAAKKLKKTMAEYHNKSLREQLEHMKWLFSVTRMDSINTEMILAINDALEEDDVEGLECFRIKDQDVRSRLFQEYVKDSRSA